MSAPEAPLDSARETGERAAEWLERRERGDFGADDQLALDAWLAHSMAHRTAYWRVSAAWERANRLGALGQNFGAPKMPAASSRGSFFAFKRVAAVVAFLALLGSGAFLYWLSFAPPPDATYATSVGGRKVIALTDGSTIELNTDTILRLDGADRRKVWLDKGEAYFDIHHNAAHPFVVVANGHRVTDLGTKFFIREDASRLEVALIEGKASLQPANGKIKAQILTPGHVAVATADLTSVTAKPVKMLANDLSWRSGVLVFRRMTLADAASEFNRYNRKKLLVNDPAVAGLRIDGTFPASNVEAFLDAVQAALNLHIEDRGDEAVISR
ncbi:MAG TPA: FecR domain-containing protein [Rhizomicrobium sp.]